MIEPSVVMSLSMLINITFTISDESLPSNLTEIDFELNEKIVHSSDNISETKEEDVLDDFEGIFNSIGLRIAYFSFWIIFMTLSNGFFTITILFEKYGEDIMKRSIDNQLWSQVAMAMLLYNCVCLTIFLVRFNYGPLYFAIASFESYIANCWISWGLLILAELSVVKALSIYKFSWVVNIDEVFAGRFLLRLNLGYILVSQTSRFVLKRFVQYSRARANLNSIFGFGFFHFPDTFLDIIFKQCTFSFYQASNLVMDKECMDQYISQSYY